MSIKRKFQLQKREEPDVFALAPREGGHSASGHETGGEALFVPPEESHENEKTELDDPELSNRIQGIAAPAIGALSSFAESLRQMGVPRKEQIALIVGDSRASRNTP